MRIATWISTRFRDMALSAKIPVSLCKFLNHCLNKEELIAVLQNQEPSKQHQMAKHELRVFLLVLIRKVILCPKRQFWKNWKLALLQKLILSFKLLEYQLNSLFPITLNL
jgi:hypothetical protein